MSNLEFIDSKNGTALTFLQTAKEAESLLTAEKTNPFKPLGIGKPMTIQLESVYAGDYKNGLFNGTRDMAVFSTMKTLNMNEVEPMAVHQIFAGMPERQLTFPSARRMGTPLIYCTPSFIDEGMMLSIDFKIDNFKANEIKAVGELLSAAGSIPIFSYVSLILKVGGEGIKLLTPFINSQLKKKSWLSYDFDLVIRAAGRGAIKSGFHLMCNTNDRSEFENFQVSNPDGGRPNLIHIETHRTYDGARPYGIISINGAMEDKYSDFTRAIASIALMEDYYGQTQKQQFSESSKEWLDLYNDFMFSSKIQKAQNKLKTLEKGSEEYKEWEGKISAYEGNLLTDIFKKKQN